MKLVNFISLTLESKSFIAALFTIARKWKQPQCPLTNEWLKKLYVCVYIYICICMYVYVYMYVYI